MSSPARSRCPGAAWRAREVLLGEPRADVTGRRSGPGGADHSSIRMLEAAELANDPRFATNLARVVHRAECDAEVGARTRRWSTRQLDARLDAAGIPAAEIRTLAHVVDHEQLRARKRWRHIEIERGTVQALLPPATFDDVEAAMGAVPALGQHTHALLVESGLAPAAAEDVVSRGVAYQPAQRSSVGVA